MTGTVDRGERNVVVPRLRRRFIASLCLLGVLFGLSGAYTQWTFLQHRRERDAVTLLEQYQLESQELVTAGQMGLKDLGPEDAESAFAAVTLALADFDASLARLGRSPRITSEVLTALTESHDEVVGSTRTLMDLLATDTSTSEGIEVSLGLQKEAVDEYRQQLRDLSEALIHSSNERVAHIQQFGVITFAITMSALLSLGRQVFLPAVRQVDVSWKKLEEREEQLVLAQAAAVDSNRAKSDFLANMSHELRTPMNGVIGMASLLAETSLDDEQAEYLQAIRESGNTLLSVINDILDFSKIEARQLDIESYSFELRGQLEGALDVISPMLANKNLSLVFDVDRNLPERFVSDPARIRQIVNNFLSNAVKFTEQGEIILRVTGEQISTDRHGGQQGEWQLHFEVSDTGIGVPADRIERLFRSFSQVDSSHARRFGGTGLGLAISKQLAELMGGTAWAESVEGQGSTFHFTILARCEDSPRASAFFASEHERFQGRSVLVVEHNHAALAHLDRQLAMWGIDVVAASTYEQALDAVARGHRFDAAVIDTHLPGDNGVDLARKLSEESPDTALILMTPLGERLTRTDLHVSAHVSKPIKASSLFDALMEVVADGELANQQLSAGPVPRGAKRSLRILLAEDNQVNQKVAVGLLRKFGYDADVVSNGMEAITMLERRPYDVILMDVHMPEMDGCEATKRIRESFEPARQPWIIAMTANALSGDRERFLSIGMDDYVSKPVQPRRLADALDAAPKGKHRVEMESLHSEDVHSCHGDGMEFLRADHDQAETRPAVQIIPPAQVADHPAVLDRMVLNELGEIIDDTHGLARAEIIDTFVEDAADRLQLIREQLGVDNASVQLQAHTVKSSAANVGALRLSALCGHIESVCRDGGVGLGQETAVQLAAEFDHASEQLLAFRSELHAHEPV